MTKPADQNLRQQSKARTLEKVADAARALFQTVGYTDTTIRAIAVKAGMSTGAFFASFKDKAECYRGLFGHDPLTPEQGLAMAAALRRAESFIQGFEGDPLQEGVDVLLAEIRSVLPPAPTEPTPEDEAEPMREAA